MSREGPWVWYAEDCVVCRTAITSSKAPVEAAREEVMVRELAYYMKRHIVAKHPEVASQVYVPHPMLMPASVRGYFERQRK